MTTPRVMTMAGTDSSGGAGIAADLPTLAACGVHGCCAVTAVTVQNSLGVSGVHSMPGETVAAQVEAVVTDIGLDAVKTPALRRAYVQRTPRPQVRHQEHSRAGDSFGAALASGLAKGMSMPAAVTLGTRYSVAAVAHAYALGAGHGPVSALWTVRPWWDDPTEPFTDGS